MSQIDSQTRAALSKAIADHDFLHRILRRIEHLHRVVAAPDPAGSCQRGRWFVSPLMTAGLGNSTVATAELGGALLVSLLALAAPVAAFAIVVLMLWLAIRLILRLRRSAQRTDAPG